MAKSMTGFGRAEHLGAFELVIEIKSVNSKYCDVNIRAPRVLAALEDRIRSIVRGRLSRGKIDVFVSLNDARSIRRVAANYELLDEYHAIFGEIRDRYGIETPPTLSDYLKVENAIASFRAEDQAAEADPGSYLEALESVTAEALDKVCDMRENEGQRLAADLLAKLESIKSELGSVRVLAKGFPQRYAAQLRARIADLISVSDCAPDEAILAHEVALFADRTDVEEEMVRLATHIEHMATWLNTPPPIGRRLDFLAQEMLREINTIGSKSPDIAVAEHVINMKSYVEQIKEQIQNIL